MASITMTVNGRNVSGEAEDRTLLVEFLRSNLALTGTHVGCEHGVCGACTVMLDGKRSFAPYAMTVFVSAAFPAHVDAVVSEQAVIDVRRQTEPE